VALPRDAAEIEVGRSIAFSLPAGYRHNELGSTIFGTRESMPTPR